MLAHQRVYRSGAGPALLVISTLLLLVSASGTFSTSRQAIAAATVAFTIDASHPVYPFKDTIRGVATNTPNWLWHGLWDRGQRYSCCAPGKTAAIIDATSYIEPGIIRFAGARWVSRTGWDRHGAAPDDGAWTYRDPGTGQTYNYTHAYKPEMVDAFADFRSQLGAAAIIQVNVCDNNTRMWQDLVRYANIEKRYNFEYWEIGNEQTLEEDSCGLDASRYVARFLQYQDALKAVDPSIKVMGPVAHQLFFQEWEDTLIAATGEDLDVLAMHWYQLSRWSPDPSSFDYQGGSLESLLAFDGNVGTVCHIGFGCGQNLSGIADGRWTRWVYRRGVAEQKMGYINAAYRPDHPGLETAITELGVHATDHDHPVNGNHAAAVWLADTLPRWAYNGMDIITYYSLEDGATWGGNSRGLLGINNYDVLDVRPTFYTEFMYARYFGDMMLRSTTSDRSNKVVAWASSDSDDPDKLKLMLVNLSQDAAITDLQISGFHPSSGEAYVMRSDNPVSMSDPGSYTDHSTTINGVKIPDYRVDDPSVFRDAIDSIRPVPVHVSGRFSYTLEPYSVVALTLDGSFDSPFMPEFPSAPSQASKSQAQFQVSDSPDRSDGILLDGQAVSGDVYVWISPDENVSSAVFYMDDPEMDDGVFRTESPEPFDLMGTRPIGIANPLDTRNFSDGAHTVTALLTFKDGSAVVRSASFTVAAAEGRALPERLITEVSSTFGD